MITGEGMKLNLTKTIQIPVVGFGTYLINADDLTTIQVFKVDGGFAQQMRITANQSKLIIAMDYGQTCEYDIQNRKLMSLKTHCYEMKF